MSTLQELQQAVIDAAVIHMADPHAIGYVKDIRDRSSDDLTFLALAEAVEALQRGPIPDVWALLVELEPHTPTSISGLHEKVLSALMWHKDNPA